MIKNEKGGIGRARFLSKESMQKIHEESLRVLENTGISVDHDEALQMLGDAGADVDSKTRTVKIPPDLVEQSLPEVPRRITLAGRNPERDLLLEPGGKMHTRNAGGMTQVLDGETGEIRDAGLADLADFARLMDGLDNFDFVAPVYPSDVPSQTVELHVLAEMLSHTDKHISMRALTRRNLPYLVKMAEVVAGGKENLRKRPVISLLESSISPLRFPDVLIDTLYLGGEYGIPVVICPTPNVGATGPITLAGSLLLACAEHLATIVISQLAHPGAPLIWATRFAMMDMATGTSGMYVEAALVNAAAAQLATEQYNLICDFHGPATNSIIPDGRSVLDECIAAFVTGFVGRPSVLTGGGALDMGMIASLEEFVISNEIVGAVRRVIEGFEVDEDTLGYDAITRVGIGGNYLQDEHTFKYLRSKRFDPLFVKPQTKVSWRESGSKTMVEMARERAHAILEEHQPAPLDKKVAAGLRKVIEEAVRKHSDISESLH
jgi:trimethylamine--corrinoid protein Co-methyltransferase